MNPDIFFICSVIKTSNNPWYHTSLRSPFTPEERFKQTLETIESIRRLNDNTKILLVDCSDIDKDMEETLKNKLDYYIQLYTNEHIRNICRNSRQKGHGEILQTKAVIDFIKENNIEFKRLFKISGRYFLNENFSKENYSLEEFSFKKVAPDAASTVLYSVPYSLLNEFNRVVDHCIYVYSINDRIGFEALLPMACNPLHHVETLGVAGYVCLILPDGKPWFYTD
jgi:hypothetical protein